MGKHALQDIDGFISRRDFFYVDPSTIKFSILPKRSKVVIDDGTEQGQKPIPGFEPGGDQGPTENQGPGRVSD